MSGQLISLDAVRVERGLTPAPPVEPIVHFIDWGVSDVSQFSNESLWVLPEKHEGYAMRRIDVPHDAVQAGQEGLDDFQEAFQAAFSEAEAEGVPGQVGARAYGAYGAACILLPDIISTSDARLSKFEEMLAKLPSLGEMTNEQAVLTLVRRTAATLALLSVKPWLPAKVRQSLRRRTAKGVFTSHQSTQAAFKHYSSPAATLALAGIALKR